MAHKKMTSELVGHNNDRSTFTKSDPPTTMVAQSDPMKPLESKKRVVEAASSVDDDNYDDTFEDRSSSVSPQKSGIPSNVKLSPTDATAK